MSQQPNRNWPASISTSLREFASTRVPPGLWQRRVMESRFLLARAMSAVITAANALRVIWIDAIYAVAVSLTIPALLGIL